MATKQQAKSNVKIAHGAVVCEECELIGDVSIGTKTVIHPKARIVAEAGPIVIGDNNLIEEQVHIINKYPSDESRSSKNEAIEMTIGNNNVFEVGSYSEALRIGDSNIVECKAKLSRRTVLTNGCVIGAMCDLETDEVIPENTVIYGKHHHRRVQAERPTPQTLQLDFLTKILPNYHHILKPTSQKANVM